MATIYIFNMESESCDKDTVSFKEKPTDQELLEALAICYAGVLDEEYDFERGEDWASISQDGCHCASGEILKFEM